MVAWNFKKLLVWNVHIFDSVVVASWLQTATIADGMIIPLSRKQNKSIDDDSNKQNLILEYWITKSKTP
jgi:hypothetical protein